MKNVAIMMICMFGCVSSPDMATSEQATTPCVLPEGAPGQDVDPGVLCSTVDYIQYTADFTASAYANPTPPIRCTYQPAGCVTDYTVPGGTRCYPANYECTTPSFFGFNGITGGWGWWVAFCTIYVADDSAHTDSCVLLHAS